LVHGLLWPFTVGGWAGVDGAPTVNRIPSHDTPDIGIHPFPDIDGKGVET
jgi:hypothetical protein